MTSPTRTTGKRTDSEVVQSSLSPTRRVDRNPFQTRTYQLYLAEIGERVIRRCCSVTHRGKSSEDKFKKRAPWLVEEIAIVDTKNDKVYSSSSKSFSLFNKCETFIVFIILSLISFHCCLISILTTIKKATKCRCCKMV